MKNISREVQFLSEGYFSTAGICLLSQHHNLLHWGYQISQKFFLKGKPKMPHPQCGVGYNALDNKYASFSNIQVSTQLKA